MTLFNNYAITAIMEWPIDKAYLDGCENEIDYFKLHYNHFYSLCPRVDLFRLHRSLLQTFYFSEILGSSKKILSTDSSFWEERGSGFCWRTLDQYFPLFNYSQECLDRRIYESGTTIWSFHFMLMTHDPLHYQILLCRMENGHGVIIQSGPTVHGPQVMVYGPCLGTIFFKLNTEAGRIPCL